MKKADKQQERPQGTPRFGGSFAPPLTEATLSQYAKLIRSQQGSAQKDVMLTLLNCVKKWWEIPESEGTTPRAHQSGRGTIIPLDEKSKHELDELIPWEHELKTYGGVLESIEDKTLRDAAFHLLWFVKEFDLGREPITNDTI